VQFYFCELLVSINRGARFQIKNDATTKNSKHIDVHFNFVKAVARLGTVKFEACGTAEATANQTADFLSKALPQPTFVACYHRSGRV
jgi:hypothetical protein